MMSYKNNNYINENATVAHYKCLYFLLFKSAYCCSLELEVHHRCVIIKTSLITYTVGSFIFKALYINLWISSFCAPSVRLHIILSLKIMV